MSFLFGQLPASHQHHVRIHLPRHLKGAHRCCGSGLDEGLAAVARELSSEGAAGQGWKNRVTGQLESSRIWIYRVCKGWGSPPEHKCGLSNLKARRHGITKVVFFLCIEHSVCYYTYIPLLLLVFTFCPFSVHIQCPKQVIISKICKCSSWPYEKL